jgi:AcrR family transcriptional regulator
MEAIAARACVSKATIYRWWPSRGAVALDGLLDRVRETIAIPEGQPAVEALRYQVRALIALFADSTSGSLMRALVAEAVSDPGLAAALREQWLAPRRAVALEILRRGQADGELRPDLDDAVVLDQLFAPVYHRLVYGHEPLDDGLADLLVDQLMRGLRADRLNPLEPQ